MNKVKKTIIIYITACIILIALGVSYKLYQSKLSRVSLTNYSKFLPGNYKTEIEQTLKTVLNKSLDTNKKLVKGEIREDSFTALTDNNVTTYAFLIDIDSERQTFLVTYSANEPSKGQSASSKSNNPANSILISCPSADKRKYPEVPCTGMYNTSSETDTLTKVQKLTQSLPLVFDSFDFASRRAIHYEIVGHLRGDGKFVITINDFSGGNESAAREQLTSLLQTTNTNEENLEILYYNLAN
ncbi:MAG: hypothetical protein Q4C03_04635 [bacterium]|nr:hypothetical protein [bacterium]